MEICTNIVGDINKPLNINEDLVKIENFYNIQIIVIDSITKSKLYCGQNQAIKIFLQFSDNHFDLITNIKAYMGKLFFCFGCWKSFAKIEHHRCIHRCKMCHYEDKCNENENMIQILAY